MPKVLLGIPHGGTVKAPLLTTVLGAAFQAPCPMTVMERQGALGPDNRGILAQLAVDNEFSHLWLVDNDMTFPPDTLPRLLAHDKEIVGAAYHYRQFPLQTTVKMLDDLGHVYIPAQIPTELFVCYAIGSGCELIAVEALKRIPKPWFALEWDKHTGMVSVSDDVWFCRQAKKVGIKTWCDPTIQAKHIGDFPYQAWCRMADYRWTGQKNDVVYRQLTSTTNLSLSNLTQLPAIIEHQELQDFLALLSQAIKYCEAWSITKLTVEKL